jgi:TolA-binding protein
VGAAEADTMKQRTRYTVCLLIALPVIAGLAGCAFFNTLYNARQGFNKAQALPVSNDGKATREQIAMYDEVIKKCEKLITTYPNSKWVDDSILLIGRSFYEKQEYDEAATKFTELQDNFPESSLNEEGQYYLARSYVADKKEVQAVQVMKRYVEKYPEGKHLEETLFILGTTQMRLGESDEAAGCLDRLGRDFPKSRFKIEADIEMAEFFLEKEELEKSLEMYLRLAGLDLSDDYMMRCLLKLAETQIHLKKHEDALQTLDRLQKLTLPPEKQATELLLRGSALAGIDSLKKAIGVYRSVRAGFPKSAFSAEALFRIGVIFQERLDSLVLAQKTFDNVPGQYPQSPFAKEAIKRSANIASLIKYSQSTGTESEEQKAEAQFKLAELQLFQFNNPEKAIAEYQKIIDQYGGSDLAPKAVYSLGYIYGTVMGDSLKADEMYRFLMERYPDSQQAEFARRFLQEKGSVLDSLQFMQKGSVRDSL